jgi:hypothetical protein
LVANLFLPPAFIDVWLGGSRMTRRTVYLTIATACLATVARCGELKWLNLEVNEHRDGTEVRLHLPMPMVQAALDAVELEALHHGRVHLCTHSRDLDWRAVVRQARSTPEGQPVRIQEDGGVVTITRTGGVVTLRVDEWGRRGEQATLRVGTDLLDALDIDGSTVDVKALAAHLGGTTGEVLKVESRDADVRIWVE